MARPKKTDIQVNSKQKLLQAATNLIRTNGYGATTVDVLCEYAGVSKGTFFHYFKSKEDLAVEAANNWSTMTTEFFENAPYREEKDPLKRLIGYIQFRKQILKGEVNEFTCLVGTMVQETFSSNPEIRSACFNSIFNHAAGLEEDIAAAKELYRKDASWTPKSLALHTQAVLQGAFILAKASGEVKYAEESVDHLENYIRLLFN